LTPPKINTAVKMTKIHERVLIGSSNVANFYKKTDFEEYPDYQMIKSTRIGTFKAQMMKIDQSNKLVVISVIENFLADAARKGEEEDPETYEVHFDEILSSAIQEFVEVVKEAATRLPTTTFLLVKPILRPALNWYDLNFEEICDDLKEKLAKINCDNVSEIESLSRASQNFAADEVHLTTESGRLFVDCIISAAEAYYNAGPVIDLAEEEDERMETNQPISTNATSSNKRKVSFRDNQAKTSQEIGSRLEMVEAGLKKLEAEFKLKAWKDSLMTAKLREDIDFMTNVKNEDRIVLTGLTATTPPPQKQEEKIAWIRNIAKEFVKTIDPESSEKINFVKQGRSKDKDIPMAEVRFETKEIASALRRKFVEMRKAGHDFGRVYMANCVTLATRVRVDILKSIVKQFTGKDDLEMYVAAYTSRPVLKIKNVKTQNISVHTFTDALLRFGKRLDLNDIDDAYRRAGRAFTGNMEQNFVVLTDNKRIPTPAQLSGPSGQNKKRPLEDQQTAYNRNKGARVERGGRRGGRGTFMFRGKGKAGISNPETSKN
jgi:hypothetical protein